MHGHVHNGVYFSYVETAINEFLRTSELSGCFDPKTNDHAYHVKKVEIVYHRPAGLDDILDVDARVARISISSIVFSATATRTEDSSVVAEAEVVWVCVESDSGRTIPVPEETRAALTAACR
jgi:acyl-CoA thioester hydrolase